MHRDSNMKTVTLYLVGAAVAALANIATQEITWRFVGSSGLYYSMFAGTGAGLLVKYVWDKRLIFAYRAASPSQDLLTFLLYSSMGLATTAIFWGVELSFWYAFQSTPLRYVGGAIGLGLGYWIKYQLDKRFVFNSSG